MKAGNITSGKARRVNRRQNPSPDKFALKAPDFVGLR